MKVFDLHCADGHRFEGWFASSERFEEQRESGSIRCPLCDSAEVRRTPSAPRVITGEAASGPIAAAGSPTPGSPSVEAAVIARLKRLLAATEDVGARFAEEARRIHYEETPARPIRGTATDGERRALHDEGIETMTVPIPRLLTETVQ